MCVCVCVFQESLKNIKWSVNCLIILTFIKSSCLALLRTIQYWGSNTQPGAPRQRKPLNTEAMSVVVIIRPHAYPNDF